MDFKIYGDRNGSLEGEGTRLTKEVPAGLGAGGGGGIGMEKLCTILVSRPTRHTYCVHVHTYSSKWAHNIYTAQFIFEVFALFTEYGN